ncbi:MAG TPA: histidine phosphatase family protein [Candidatus Saccharimonadales bacterium]|nr:histidine phosphatase family protein [Candidatus Saccharimonadales bacterium]
MPNRRNLESGYHNRFWVMRHGDNELAGVINSNPRVADRLTEAGQEAIIEAAFSEPLHGIGSRALIYTSALPRAFESAVVLAEALSAEPPTVNQLLNERLFGLLEGESTANYERVWRADRGMPETKDELKNMKVELPSKVLKRVLYAVSKIDLDNHFGEDIVLVTHGDVAGIAVAGFGGLSSSQHRDAPPLGLAEVRRLV